MIIRYSICVTVSFPSGDILHYSRFANLPCPYVTNRSHMIDFFDLPSFHLCYGIIGRQMMAKQKSLVCWLLRNFDCEPYLQRSTPLTQLLHQHSIRWSLSRNSIHALTSWYIDKTAVQANLGILPLPSLVTEICTPWACSSLLCQSDPSGRQIKTRWSFLVATNIADIVLTGVAHQKHFQGVLYIPS